MFTNRTSIIHCILILGVSAMTVVPISSCGKKPVPSAPPTAIDFSLALQYAQRAALAYEQDSTIQIKSGTGVRVSISGPVSSGMQRYGEVDDTKRVQWVVVRGPSSLVNIRSDVDYNKVVDSRLNIPLHKGFADAAVQVYQFAKPLLKSNYETRLSGHSYGGGAGALVFLFLQREGVKLRLATTFCHHNINNRRGGPPKWNYNL